MKSLHPKTENSEIVKYILSPERLRRGDIILTTTNQKTSRIIKLVTNSSFSHAMLYVDNFSCIESTMIGVAAVNMQRVLFDDPSFCKVLRYKECLTDSTVDDVISYARQKIGMEYSVKEAINAGIRLRNRIKNSNRQFCSRLVAQAYSQAGVPIVRNCDYSSPEKINLSGKLVEVKNILRAATVEEIKFATEKNTPIDQQNAMQKQILVEVRKLTGIDVQTFEHIGGCAIAFPEHDEAISNILQSNGYLDFWKTDIERNPWYYDVERCVERFHPDQIRRIKYLLNEPETRKRYIGTLESLIEQNKQTRRRYFSDHIQLYKQLIHLSETRENVLNVALIVMGQ